MPLKIILGLSLLIVSTTVLATKNTSTGTITKIYAYDDYGNGDVLIEFSTNLDECPTGVYLDAESPGFKTLTSFALTAYTSGKNVSFQVYEERIWGGSSMPRCEVDTIILN
ncbi:hypothetical protein [Kangiella sp. TOML190]|uniref:hypothetical protein n=1 Tax=Kangiella sp. TOML190 TaxID=2931351 RepID=UPI00203AB108|nr:hypothetical protein [Kangiella sp. TOML190]